MHFDFDDAFDRVLIEILERSKRNTDKFISHNPDASFDEIMGFANSNMTREALEATKEVLKNYHFALMNHLSENR